VRRCHALWRGRHRHWLNSVGHCGGSLDSPLSADAKVFIWRQLGGVIAKGLFIGILTAIPTPLPGLITGGGGLLGWAKQLQAAKE